MNRRKITLIYLLCSISFLISSCSENYKETILKGKYSGKNLFIQNPFSDGDENNPFCIKEIVVNDKAIGNTILSTAFEIDFEKMNFQEGDEIKIVIKSSKDCKPILLNPEVIL